MGLRARLRRLGERTPVRAGVTGALVTSAAGIFGYVVLPVLVGAQPSLTEASIAAATDPTRFSVPYHVAVVVLPPFVAALAGTLFVRRRGIATRRTDATVVGGTVLGPLVTVFLGYFVTAFAFGAAAGLRGDGWDDRAFGAVGFTAWALIFGLFFLLVAFPAVAVVEGTAAAAGYLCARGVWRVVGGDEAVASAPVTTPEADDEASPQRADR